ncbi:MAG TPA: MbcA/ParS/Xre antitoxin family protein, partial [Planctomycetota bacterium]|nr:MbcA/ParS/Xre antitoxin family protein [Planctomycetota bacterium]
RSRPGARTVAEGLLTSGALPSAVQALLAARSAAPIGLFRVAAVRAGEGVELEDVLRGGRVSVPDSLLSATAREGVVLFGKVYPAGAFTFLAGLSAPLPGDSERMLQQLESEGLEVSEAGLQQTAHRLGRLWQLRADQATSRPQLVNTDGDELMDVRASFAVRDPAAVRAALLARDDVEVEGGDEADAAAPLVWFRPRGDGSRTLLARLEFLGGELVATANSDERLRKLRTWLLPVAGVLREVSETRREFLAAPADDRLHGHGREEPTSPELLDAITGHMRAHYRRWLDEPIPALGGKTPRQAVKTADGQRKVARLIRTTPDPMGPSGPLRGAVPREDMLRELGLEGQGEAEV